MLETILTVGEGYEESDVVAIDKNDIVTVMLIGGRFSQVNIDIRTFDGAVESNAPPIFRTFRTMRGLDPASAVVQLHGPLDFRVSRLASSPEAGCSIRRTTGA